ncbi:S26 family signal peptidase [Candidatus Aalborgicola defluviihabitans]|uniref:S26 family signal peptidase n=1 Tax=Candidatus Aalborgicola defluviihabitans TaxID=3386187 RepID=UPI0039B8CA01
MTAFIAIKSHWTTAHPPGLAGHGHLAGSTRTVQFLPDVMARRNWGPVVVPHDQYFFWVTTVTTGADSRYIGLVPRHLLIGRAHHIVVSAAIKEDWQPRMERTAQRIQ